MRSLRILSGFYGVVRPLDAIKAYRLEMGTKMANARGKDLYAFWGDRCTRLLLDGPGEGAKAKGKVKAEKVKAEKVEAAAGGLRPGDCIIDVASKEYSKVLDFDMLKEAGVTLYEMKFPGAVRDSTTTTNSIESNRIESNPLLSLPLLAAWFCDH